MVGFFLTDEGVSCKDINMLPVTDLRTCQSAAARLRSMNNDIEFSKYISKNPKSKCWFASSKYVKYKPHLESSKQICLSGIHEKDGQTSY